VPLAARRAPLNAPICRRPQAVPRTLLLHYCTT